MTHRPRTATAIVALAAALTMLLGSAAVPAALPTTVSGSSSETPAMMLRLKAATFDPLLDGVDWVPAGYRLSASDPFGDLYVVQLTGKTRAGQREAMVDLGAAYHSYLPDNAFLVSASSEVIGAVADLSFVRTVIPWEPFFRIAGDLKTAAWRSAPGDAMVKAENFGDPGRLIAFAEARGGTFLLQDGAVTTLSIPRSLLLAVASLPTVNWVEPWVPRELDNYLSSVAQGARQFPDGAYSASALRLWSYNAATGLFEGTTGKDVIVAVSDTGVDTTHPAFSGKIVFFDPMGGPYRDTYGHGTHTSGTVLGSGAYRANDTGLPAATPGRYAGIAPEARLVHQNIFGSSSSNALAALDNGMYGATISSGSWANGGGYGTDSRQYDGFARDSWPDTTNASSFGPQGVLYFFSAGNAGGSRTIGNPAEGKNVVAVGATGNNKGTSWDQMAGFSSRGPADDGRIKPDLVAPGVDVMSSYCSSCSMGVGNQIGMSYGEQSGTSMSCPGAAAVAYQFYRDREGAGPSPDMLKAILINGVDEMADYPVLGAAQGFGRMNLSTSLLTLSNRQQLWMDRPTALATDDEVVYTYPVADAVQPFVVTLAWLDEPGDTGASPEIVNDLDLWVVGPSGAIYRGNAMDEDGDSLANGVVDNKNTVEKVKVSAPARGYYEVHVKGSNVPVGPQDFSLAIRGNVATDWYDILLEKVDTNASKPIEGDEVTFNATVWNRGTHWVNGSEVTLEATTPQGASPVGTFFPPDIAPNTKYTIATNWTTVRGNISFAARVAPPFGETEFSTTNNEGNTSFFVRGYGYTLVSDGAPSYQVNPGTTVSITFNVTQTGNVPDNVSAFVTTDNPAMSAFLDYVRVSVNPGQSKLFHLTVVVPTSAKAGDHVSLTVTTRSLSDARHSASFMTSVEVNHLYGFAFSLSPNEALLPPTGRAVSSITLENRGNGQDTFALTSIGVPGGWTFEFTPASVTLADNATATVTVTILAPGRADAGAHFVIGVRAASNGAPPQLLNFSATVTQIYGWTASASGPQNEVDAGTVIEIPISAQNLGNGIDEVVIDLTVPPGWQSALTRPRLLLLPYGNLTSLASVTIDRWALAGSYTLRFTFGGARNFTIQTIPVEIKMDFRLEVDGPGYTLQMGQGEVNTFEVTVVNEGNGRAPVTPSVIAPEGVTIISVVPGAVLERNETAKFTFQVIVARDAAATLHNFTVDLRSGEGDTVSNPLGMYLNVHEVVEAPPPTGTGGGGSQSFFQALLGVVAVVALAMPVGLLYLRRQASKRAPPTQVIIQTVEDANSGVYDPNKGTVTPAVAAARATPARAPRGAAPGMSAGMTIVGVCKNCGGAVVDLGNQVGRCRSCGVEQIVRPVKR